MFDPSNNDLFSFTIDPYSPSFLHSPLMYCEFDNEFLINNEEQLTVIQQTETMKPDCDTASFVRASNCNLVEAASTDLNSSDFNGIVEDANTRSATNSVSARRLLTAAAARRVSKRDRHSKIHTAQGPRDRRVRLSLDVARHFFKLQDMLGFDKPSRTVNWLLMQSEPAIQQLIVDTRKESRSLSSNKNASSTSECCGELENGNTIDHDEITTAANRSSLSHSQQQKQQEEDRGILIKDAVYKPTDHHKDRHRKGRQQSARNCRGSLLPATCPQAKERRNRARYRARKRTKEKEESRTRNLYFDQQKLGRTDTNNDEVIMQHHQEQQSISQQLRVDSCGTFETTGEESGTLSQNMKPLGGEVQSEIHDTARQSERDHVRDMCGSSSLAPAENWSPLTAFYYPHNQEICQVCPVTEFQYYGTSWDA